MLIYIYAIWTVLALNVVSKNRANHTISRSEKLNKLVGANAM